MDKGMQSVLNTVTDIFNKWNESIEVSIGTMCEDMMEFASMQMDIVWTYEVANSGGFNEIQRIHVKGVNMTQYGPHPNVVNHDKFKMSQEPTKRDM